MKSFMTALLLALAIARCDAPQSSQYEGALYFGQGAYLMRFSLRDGSLSVAGHMGNTTIREVSALGADRLLIAETVSIDRRGVPRISWIDPKTGESADLYAGVLARRLAQAEVVVYDDGSHLFAVPQADGTANKIIFSHPQNRLLWMVEAAPGILLFEAGEAGEPAIHSWNAFTGEVRTLNVLTAACRLEGAVWLGPLDRLACKRRDGPVAAAEYVLAGLDGSVDGSLELPEGRQFLALTYINGQHALVLQETWRGLLGRRDKYAVWIHDIQTGAMQRLAGNVNLGGSAVYAPF